jgi:hypothetical protein
LNSWVISGCGPSRQAAFSGPTVANGALRTWLDLQLAPPVVMRLKVTQGHERGLLITRAPTITLMSRAGVPSDLAERCLGHTIGGVRGTYDRHEFYAEKRGAFEALAVQIERIINPPPDNLLPLRAVL